MSKQLKFECVAEQKQFVNTKTGETIDYVAVGVIINGQYIKLSLPKESKPLFNYLTEEMFK